MTTPPPVVPYIYGPFLHSMLVGMIDLGSDALMCMLVGTGYTPNQNTHQFASQVTNEITGSGYAAGGEIVTGVTTTYTYDTSGQRVTIMGGNLVWPSTTWTTGPRYAVLYDQPLGAALSSCPLVAYIDFGQAEVTSDQAFYINWPISGILTIALSS